MFEQVKLDYAYDALEPYIDALTVETHYAKHHATYTKNFNDAAEKAGLMDQSIEDILINWNKSDLGEVKTAIRNNGGGYYNHNLYFDHLGPNAGGEPTGLLAEKIIQTFSTFADFKEQISKASIGQFGSGWGWLATNASGELRIMASPNQDCPLLETEGVWRAIMAIDVWEHAYYLKYKNLRADHVKALFELIDWNKVAKNYERWAR